MLEHLKKFIFELAQDNLEEAKKAHALYANAKYKVVIENNSRELEHALVKGHCDSCGEDATTNVNIVSQKKWECGKCGSNTFVKGSKPNK